MANLGFGTKKSELVSLADVLDELKLIRTEIRDSAVLGGVVAKRGPMDGAGQPAVALVSMAQTFADKSRD
jgi:hypothetical protein